MHFIISIQFGARASAPMVSTNCSSDFTAQILDLLSTTLNVNDFVNARLAENDFT